MQPGDTDEGDLDKAFQALGDPVRRAIVARLSRGPATVNELAEPFQITTQAISRHIHVLEEAQLVTRTKEAQRRPVHLNPGRLEDLTAWIDRYRLILEQQFRSLDAVLAELDETGTPKNDASQKNASHKNATTRNEEES